MPMLNTCSTSSNHGSGNRVVANKARIAGTNIVIPKWASTNRVE